MVLFACPRDKDAQGDTIRLNAIVFRIRSIKNSVEVRLQHLKNQRLCYFDACQGINGGTKNPGIKGYRKNNICKLIIKRPFLVLTTNYLFLLTKKLHSPGVGLCRFHPHVFYLPIVEGGSEKQNEIKRWNDSMHQTARQPTSIDFLHFHQFAVETILCDQ